MTGSRDYARLVRSLLREVDFRAEEYHVAAWDTVYIGGGTPSMLSPQEIASLARPLASRLDSAKSEFTVEANPEDVTSEWLSACAEAGINRLSLGIQSMDDGILRSVNRRGNAESNRRALELAHREWKGRLSVDLIAGLPGQTETRLLEDIAYVAEYGIDHVSLYSLTIEEGTPLARIVSGVTAKPSDFLALPGDDESADIWIAGRDFLEKLGFIQYEVSNFAHIGCESAHNTTYWNLGSWIGAGPGSVGTISRADTATRLSDPPDVARWIENPDSSQETETVVRGDCIKESILMGMRTTRGITLSRFKSRFGVDLLSLIPVTSGVWESRGMLTCTENRIALTHDGLLFLNSFLASCMDELHD